MPENSFTKTASTFIGWSTFSSASTATHKDKSEITFSQNVVLYAVWMDDITVTLSVNGASSSNITQTLKYDVNTNAYKPFIVPENTFTRTGYTFAGWTSSSSSKSSTYTIGKAYSFSYSRTIYAIWAKNSITVTFDPNTTYGGNGYSFTRALILNPSTMEYEITLPENSFTNSNGKFVGWGATKKPNVSGVLKPGQVEKFDYSEVSSTEETEGLTLYAVWNKKTFTITYNLGGNGENFKEVIENQNEYGKPVYYIVTSKKPSSTLEYYSFNGWSAYANRSVATAGLKAGDMIELTDDKTIHAAWKLGTICEDLSYKNIGSRSKAYISFTLLKSESISVKVTADGALDFYCLTKENGDIWYKGNSNYEYYKDISGYNTTKVDASMTLPAGTYYYGVNNGNYLVSKNYKFTIKGN